MKRIVGFVSGILLLALLSSGILSDLCNFLLWLFALKEATKEVSVAGNILVRVLTFGITYSLVGGIFEFLGWFNSKAMKCVYFVISTIIAFVLSYIIWKIEENIVTILIVLSVLMALAVVYIIFRIIEYKRKKTA